MGDEYNKPRCGTADARDMSFQWFVTAAALILALGAWVQARRAARRLEHLSQSYWELRYQLGELSVEVRRLTEQARVGAFSQAGTDPDRKSGTGHADPTPPSGHPSTTLHDRAQAFVPIASLKR
jgi:hypothetical protein